MFNIFKRKKNISEKAPDFYDEMYRSGGHLGQYHAHYKQSRYLSVWEKGVEIINSAENPSVLDIGCGPGQFAQLLFDSGITSYSGIDFSSEAIEMAKKNVPVFADRFQAADIFKLEKLPENINFIVLFEVLEHVEQDIELLGILPHGIRVLLSVPSYGSRSHVRQFPSVNTVKSRYKDVIDIEEIIPFINCPEEGKTIYLLNGILKPKEKL